MSDAHELAVEALEAPPDCGFAVGEVCVVNPYISCGTCVACRAGKPNCCVRISVLGVHQDGGMAGPLALPAGNLVRAEGLSIDACAHAGSYVLVSVVKSAISFEDPDFHRKEMSLLGSRNGTSVDFDRVISAIRAGRVPVDKLITHRTTLADAACDLPRWATQKSGLTKAVIAT